MDDHIIKKPKGNLGYYAVLGVSLLAMTFFGVCSPKSRYGGRVIEGPAGEVNGEEISRLDFLRAYENISRNLEAQYKEQFDSKLLKVAHTTLDQLAASRILMVTAMSMGIYVSDDQVASEIKAEGSLFYDDKGQFSEENYNRFLSSQRYSEAQFLEEIRRQLINQKLRQFVMGTLFVSSKEAALEFRLKQSKLALDYIKIDAEQLEIPVTKEETEAFLAKPEAQDRIKIYFDQNKKDFEKPATVKASHILVSYKGAKHAPESVKDRTKDEAKKLAEEIMALAKAPQADFSALAKEKTDEPSGKETSGDLGLIEFQDMVEPFSKAAFALNPGDICSDVVETEFGFHIIKVFEKRPEEHLTQDQAKNKIMHELIKKEKSPIFAKDLAKRILESVQKSEDVQHLLSANKLSWEKTGSFSVTGSYIPSLGAAEEVRTAALSLKKPGEIYPQVVDSSHVSYILKLEKREETDMSLFKGDKKDELVESQNFYDGYMLYSDFEKKTKKEFEEKGKVYLNPHYLALDSSNE